VGILYFFFNHSNKNQKSGDVIRVLLTQMLGQFENVPENVLKEYKRSKTRAHQPIDHAALLTSCIKQFVHLYSSPVFVLIDAYDEFKNQGDEQKERAEFLSHLSQICQTEQAKVFITTRSHYGEDLRTTLNGVVTELESDTVDIEQYLDERLKDPTMSDELRKLAKSKIAEACGRWYCSLSL
jgi:NACHT domain